MRERSTRRTLHPLHASLAAAALLAAAPAAAAAQSGAGKATVTVSGESAGVAVSGTYAADRCGDYLFPLKKTGVVYSARLDDKYTLTVMTDETRAAGAQRVGDVTITLNGGPQPLVFAKRAGTIVFSDDFKTATVDVQLRPVVGGPKAGGVPLSAKFLCD